MTAKLFKRETLWVCEIYNDRGEVIANSIGRKSFCKKYAASYGVTV